MIKQAEIIVSGKVQGVFFRARTKNKADSLKVIGRVENLSDGTVKILAQGEQKDIEQLIGWCRHGAVVAKVDRVEVKWIETSAEFKDFKIIY